jgi:hypothetical protein
MGKYEAPSTEICLWQVAHTWHYYALDLVSKLADICVEHNSQLGQEVVWTTFDDDYAQGGEST